MMGSGENDKMKSRRVWLAGISVLAALAAALIAGRVMYLHRSAANTTAYTPYTVRRGDITLTLNASGSLQPAETSRLTSLISGKILSAPFKEGDVVQKDQVLYVIDSSEIDNSISQAEHSLQVSQTRLSSALSQLENLKLKAGGTGTVIEMSVQKGDIVQPGQAVAVIRESDTMLIRVLFQKTAAESVSPGESAVVTLGGTTESYNGSVTNVSTVNQVLPGNVIAREITVEVANPGAFSPQLTAYVTIRGLNSLQNGTFDYKYLGSVPATGEGTVIKINVSEGNRVAKGQVITVVQSDSVDQQIQSARSAVESAKLALEAQRRKIAEYTFKSPAAGTIAEKFYQEGDTLRAGDVLGTVINLSHLSLVLNVDELDIKRVRPDQSVTLTVNAAEGAEYTGTVTKVSIMGTTQNGVTSYPVTIRIDKTEGLLPGMNADVRIALETLEDVLTVPVDAVIGSNLVPVKTAGQEQEKPEPGIPAGFTLKEVTLGPSTDTDIVITQGLKEGDIIAVIDDTPLRSAVRDG
ncbi:MAG: HlyD family efflux transporter periplasmic adaptor subunit [Clostridiales bacterium]|nr:HlyD family efflux transporter periplasmic adaptor subunit [Clostridiales bacterium]